MFGTGHTFRDSQVISADRFTACEKFRDMNEKEKADILEKYKACARCTSWLHKRDSKECKAPKNSCVKCQGDHSHLVCGFGSAYTASAKFSTSANVSSSSDSSDDSDIPDLTDETMMLLQDVRVKFGSSSSEARVLWDKGSNRVLIRHSFAKQMQLRSHQVSFKISVVGGRDSYEDGVRLIS